MMRRIILGLLCLGAVSSISAQTQLSKPVSHEIDLAVGYNAERSNLVSGSSFWEQGGSAEASAGISHGFGLAILVSAGHASNIGGTNVNLTTANALAGPRYTWGRRQWAVFGEGAIGGSVASDTVFPSASGYSSTSSLATQVGGGMDLRLSPHFGVRVFQASWLRTEFPNTTTNVQNALQVGAGIVFRLRR